MRYTVSERALFDFVRTFKGRPRHCAVNALRHLDRAWALKKRDPEMAVLRAITAEEEAATAILFTIKSKRYHHSDRLRPRCHLHKQALVPFLQAIDRYRRSFASLPFQPRIRIARPKGGTPWAPRVELVLRDGRVALPVPPLGFSLTDERSGKPYYFNQELEEIATRDGRRDVIEALRKRANLRNVILYASDQGAPLIGSAQRQRLLGERTRRTRCYWCFLSSIRIRSERCSFSKP